MPPRPSPDSPRPCQRNTPPGLREIHDQLFAAFGPQHWWPGRTPFEVMVGAVLTQNTNWRNVERAIANLRAAGRLSARKLLACPAEELAELIRPSGYYNVKADRLLALTQWYMESCNGRIDRLAGLPLATARAALLAVRGVGRETADSILLYAAGRPTFVVDAYTRRIFSRLIRAGDWEDYETVRARFMTELPEDVALYNEYHALIVRLGKEHCRPTPRCAGCPLATADGNACESKRD